MEKLCDFASNQCDLSLKAIRQWTRANYNFRDIEVLEAGDDRDLAITHNAELATSLMEGNRFTLKDIQTGEGPYQHKIIEVIIEQHWFRFKRAVGERHQKLFVPVSIPLVAYVFTMVESCIKEHLSGTPIQASFQPDNYRTRFQFFCEEMQSLSNHSDELQAKPFNYFMWALDIQIRNRLKKIRAQGGMRFDDEICGGFSSD
ncbi:hypothetical protein FRC11_002364 [Ceratobasidium sp. 423]|nr:hypothetical protein FRC11_002364 [Ceratobasidium sp. 423]